MTASDKAAEPSIWNVPNLLTAIRVLMVPLFGWVLLTWPDDPGMRWLSTAIFIVAIATDAVDGYLARKHNLITNFGKLADSIADKALTGMAFIGLSILDELPWWITVVILAREWGITVLRFAILKYGVMAANRGGKLKTVMQSVAIILFLPGLPLMPTVWDVVAWAAMIIALVLTIVTGADYLRAAARMRAAHHAANPGERP